MHAYRPKEKILQEFQSFRLLERLPGIWLVFSIYVYLSDCLFLLSINILCILIYLQSMGSHSLFEGGEKEAKERLLYCKPKLFLINNLYSIRLYLSERREVLQRSTTSSQPVSPSHGQLHTTKSLTPSELKIIEFHDVVDEKLQLEMQHFILAVLRTLVISPDDINFSKQFENDKTNKGKMLKSMFSVSEVNSEKLFIEWIYVYMAFAMLT